MESPAYSASANGDKLYPHNVLKKSASGELDGSKLRKAHAAY